MKLSQLLFLVLGFLTLSQPIYAADTSVEFHTKNYNVICLSDSVGSPYVGCSIKRDFVKHKYQPIEPCELDWGQNFVLNSKSKAELECAGDTNGGSDNSKLLEIGQTIKGNGWSCTALKNDGIQCMNTSQKNGFILQKHRQVLINKR